MSRYSRLLQPILFLILIVLFYITFRSSIGEVIDQSESKLASETAIPTVPDKHSTSVQPTKPRPVKSILLYSKFFWSTDWHFNVGGPEVFERNGCPVTECSITFDRTQEYSEYDAILFHAQNMKYIKDEKGTDEDRPDELTRRPEQVYVVMFYESPMITFVDWQDKYVDYFNWSMTYRYDIGDITSPYGWISEELGSPPKLFAWKHKKPELTPERVAYLKQNSRLIGEKWKKQESLALWIVSNCGDGFSKRESYVRELEKYISIDIFGKCSNRSLPNVGYGLVCPSCLSPIEGQYKFILSFENSWCDGYVTEKFWHGLDINIIPVVRGGAKYTEVAPPGSYIDSKDFKSAKDLGEYLLHLDEHQEEYENFFWWKDFYSLNSHKFINSAGICEVCRRLHEEELPPRSVHNLTELWTREDCVNPDDIQI